MSLIDWFKEIFREKEYYQTEYDTLNNFSIDFKEFSDEIEMKLKDVIANFRDAEKLNDEKAGLYITSSKKTLDIDELFKELKSITLKDYRQTYFEAQKENWDFKYFITDSGGIYDDTLFLSNKLSYPNDNDLGDVMYPLLAIKKREGTYYIWDLSGADEASE